jgi:hypothetical protein
MGWRQVALPPFIIHQQKYKNDPVMSIQRAALH